MASTLREVSIVVGDLEVLQKNIQTGFSHRLCQEVRTLKLNLKFLKTFLMLAYRIKLANMDISLEFNDVKEVSLQNFVSRIEDTLKKHGKDTRSIRQSSQISFAHLRGLEKSFATVIISLWDDIKPFMQTIIEVYSGLLDFWSWDSNSCMSDDQLVGFIDSILQNLLDLLSGQYFEYKKGQKTAFHAQLGENKSLECSENQGSENESLEGSEDFESTEGDNTALQAQIEALKLEGGDNEGLEGSEDDECSEELEIESTDGYNTALHAQIEALQDKLIFLKNLTRFAKSRGVEQGIMENLLTHCRIAAVYAALFSCRCLFYQEDEQVRSPEMCSLISDLVQKIQPVNPLVCEIYIKVLKPSRSSSSSRGKKMDKRIMQDFNDSLISSMWDLLCSGTSLPVAVKDQMQTLYAGLRFFRSILKERRPEIDVLNKKIVAVLAQAGILICSLFVDKVQDTDCCAKLADANNNINLIKAQISSSS
ncbi:uncharacterized protein [Coffea arabica]|uniref:Late blight resistance protein R1A-like N-terminal domain-containing protein n=1 Tax=Coffea arabica TaxID=13443 RepID=A0A6P6S8C5_COFAR|nr:uncharacterized protein LOC113688814 [Coffea arabica]